LNSCEICSFLCNRLKYHRPHAMIKLHINNIMVSIFRYAHVTAEQWRCDLYPQPTVTLARIWERVRRRSFGRCTSPYRGYSDRDGDREEGISSRPHCCVCCEETQSQLCPVLWPLQAWITICCQGNAIVLLKLIIVC